MSRPLAPPSLELPQPHRSPWGFVASLLLHVVLVAVLVMAHWRGILAWADVAQAGDPAVGAGGGGGGGGRIQVVALPALGQVTASKGLIGRLVWSLPKEGEKPASDGKSIELLRFLNDFFKNNSEILFADNKVAAFITDNASTFEEVEKICQA